MSNNGENPNPPLFVHEMLAQEFRAIHRDDIRPPHSPTPVRVLTVHDAAGAKAIS